MTENLEHAASGDDAAARELTELQHHIAYLEEALQAISSGGVDAVMIGEHDQQRIYTLTSADRPYRVIVESMGEGAITVSESGVVLFANAQVATFLGLERDSMIGRDIASYVDPSQHEALHALLGSQEGGATRRGPLTLAGPQGEPVEFLAAVTDLDVEDVIVRCLVLTDLTMQKQMEHQLAQRAAESERQNMVREVNDTIVQGLVTAEMALDLGQHDYARAVIARTSDQARQWIGELAEGRQLVPGMAVRRRPAGPLGRTT